LLPRFHDSRCIGVSADAAHGQLLQLHDPTPTTVLCPPEQTFACDEEAVEGESYLRADYSLSCNTSKHTWYKAYAGIMLVVSSRGQQSPFGVGVSSLICATLSAPPPPAQTGMPRVLR